MLQMKVKEIYVIIIILYKALQRSRQIGIPADTFTEESCVTLARQKFHLLVNKTFN